MMLPPPLDSNFKLPEFSEVDFLHPKGEEDEQLLETGAWDNDPLIEEAKDDAENEEIELIEELSQQ